MGMWAIEPQWFGRMFSLFQAGQLPMRAAMEDERPPAPPYTVEAPGIAVIHIEGQMVKGESSFGGANSVALRKAVRDANRDDAVKALALLIDSPGGSVAGTQALADEVGASAKPVYAYIEDLGASAAYWVASQAKSISMNALGEAGSIGVYAVVEDSSGRYERLGIKVHVVSTGDFKGAFVEGSPVTEKQLDYVREQVGQVNEAFMGAVARGRRMEADAVKAVADGRTFMGAKAQELGLVDRIEGFEAFMDRIAKGVMAEQERAARRSQNISQFKKGLTLGKLRLS